MQWSVTEYLALEGCVLINAHGCMKAMEVIEHWKEENIFFIYVCIAPVQGCIALYGERPEIYHCLTLCISDLVLSDVGRSYIWKVYWKVNIFHLMPTCLMYDWWKWNWNFLPTRNKKWRELLEKYVALNGNCWKNTFVIFCFSFWSKTCYIGLQTLLINQPFFSWEGGENLSDQQRMLFP